MEMRLPADEPSERRSERLIGDERAHESDGRPDHHDDERHADEPGPGFGEKARRRDRGHQRDDAAHEPGDSSIGEGEKELDYEQGDEQRLRLAREVPQEGEQARWRLWMIRNR